MNLIENHIKVFKNFNNFKDKANRKEYWYFMLSQMLVGLAIVLLAPVLSPIYNLLSILPTISVMVRRLRDSGFSPYWGLTSLIPFINLGLLVLLTLPSRDK